MRKVEERGERQKERKRRILTAEPLSFWVAEERKRRERKSQYREREREREGREERGERREEIVSVSLSVFIFGVSGVYFSEHAPFTCTPNRLRFVKN